MSSGWPFTCDLGMRGESSGWGLTGRLSMGEECARAVRLSRGLNRCQIGITCTRRPRHEL